MARRAARKLKKLGGEESPEKSSHPGLPPEGNKGRCRVCKRMLDACLIEISRRTPTEGIVTQRAYACRDHAAELAEKLVASLASWTVWARTTHDEPETVVEDQLVTTDEPDEPSEPEAAEESGEEEGPDDDGEE